MFFFSFGSISVHSTDGNIEFCVFECKAFKVFLILDVLELFLRFFVLGLVFVMLILITLTTLAISKRYQIGM